MTLAVRDLVVTIGGSAVVRGLSLDVARGQTLGIVGESGSGKSMTALAVMGLLPVAARAAGSIALAGEELVGAPERRLCALRGDRMAMVFQEPMTALNPVHRIGDQVAESLILHRGLARGPARARARELLARVGIDRPQERLDSYPHELSGGQRQRVVIALALACAPDLVIADEPTSALDVTVQAQIVELLGQLADETGMALVLISHDLGVIGQLADRVVVMYAGAVAEEGPTGDVFRRRVHPYTEGLFGALPQRGGGRRLRAIPGTVPAPADLPPGCPFYGRCPRGQDVCRDNPPPWVDAGPGHRARCFFPVTA